MRVRPAKVNPVRGKKPQKMRSPVKKAVPVNTKRGNGHRNRGSAYKPPGRRT